MSKKKTFVVPVYAYVPVTAQLRGSIEIHANSLEEAQEIARKISGIKYEDLPKDSELDVQKLEWDDDPSGFSEYVEHERDGNNLINIRVNEDDLDSVEEV